MVTLLEKEIIIIKLLSQYCVIVEAVTRYAPTAT